MTPAEPAAFPSGLLFNGKIYHQHHGEQPQMVAMVWGRNLTSRDDARKHRLTIGPEWVRLPTDGAGYVVVHNERAKRQTIPTPEERMAETALVVDLSFGSESFADTPDLVVRPGEFQPLGVALERALYARCPTGSTQATIYAYPG